MCGIHLQPGEDERSITSTNPVTREIINRVCAAAQINIGENDIDVCHRLGAEVRSPIIIRFNSKSARYNFFSQRKKLINISTTDLNYDNLPSVTPADAAPNERAGGGRSRGGRHGGPAARNVESFAVAGEPNTDEDQPIYMQEHLTKFTKDLLKEAKETFTALEYEFPGYIKDGEVRVKRRADDKPMSVRAKTDIAYIANLNKKPDGSG